MVSKGSSWGIERAEPFGEILVDSCKESRYIPQVQREQVRDTNGELDAMADGG